MERKTNVVEIRIRKPEFDALLACDADVRYKYAMKRIADTEYLWTIGENEDMCSIQQIGNKNYFLVWSSKEYAIDFCSRYFKESVCIPILIYDFIDSMADSLKEDGYNINVFPTHLEEFGKIVDVDKFCNDLEIELEDYE